MKKDIRPLPLVVETMPGRDMRTTYVDQHIYAGSTGVYGVYPQSPLSERKGVNLPY